MLRRDSWMPALVVPLVWSALAWIAHEFLPASAPPAARPKPVPSPELQWASETVVELLAAGAIAQPLSVSMATDAERRRFGFHADSTDEAAAGGDGGGAQAAANKPAGPPVPPDFDWPGDEWWGGDPDRELALPPPPPPPVDWRRIWPGAEDRRILVAVLGLVDGVETPWARATRVDPPLGLDPQWRIARVQRIGNRLLLWPALLGASEITVRLAVAIAATEPKSDGELGGDWDTIDDAEFATRCTVAGLWRARVRAWTAQRNWRRANFAWFFDARVARVRAVEPRFALRQVAAGVLGEAMLRVRAAAPPMGEEGELAPDVLASLAAAAETARPRCSEDVMEPERMLDPDRRSAVVRLADSDPSANEWAELLGLPGGTEIVAKLRIGAFGLSALVSDPRRGFAAALADAPSAWRQRSARGSVGDSAYLLAAADGRRIGAVWWCAFESRDAAGRFSGAFQRLRSRLAAKDLAANAVLAQRGRSVAVAFGLVGEETEDWRDGRLPRWLAALQWVDAAGAPFDPSAR